MLVQLGQRNASDDLVGLLTECHGRMRKYLVLAHRLAEAPVPGLAGTPEHDSGAEIREVAGQIRRYFTESFPLHLADEDEQLAPRLAGTNPAVDHALARMTREHVAHDPAIQRLIALCTQIAQDPRQLGACAVELSNTAAWLATELESHLELEEREIFPYIRRLPAAEQDAIRATLRERRVRSLH